MVVLMPCHMITVIWSYFRLFAIYLRSVLVINKTYLKLLLWC